MDAFTAFGNPAGMTQLEPSQMLVGFEPMQYDLRERDRQDGVS